MSENTSGEASPDMSDEVVDELEVDKDPAGEDAQKIERLKEKESSVIETPKEP